MEAHATGEVNEPSLFSSGFSIEKLYYLGH